MRKARWQRIQHLYHQALERPADVRERFVREMCDGDPALLDEVQSLLDQPISAERFLVTGDSGSGDSVYGAITPGATVGTYRVERLLGRGGMGAVFLAYDTALRRQVALKVIAAPADQEASRRKLLLEARNAAALNHPNICTIYEVGDASATAFIAMEYVDGRPLGDLVASGTLSLSEAIRYGIQAADAVGYAHDRGVIHGDLKTANVIVAATGQLKIIDFGLARRDDTMMATAATVVSLRPPGVAIGTPYAMAPEQTLGGITDSRSDIWALGVLLHEMASRAKPFCGATAAEVFSSILFNPPAPLPASVPASYGVVVNRCLAKDPNDRYQSAAQVRRALESVHAAPRPRWWMWRNRVSPGPAIAVAAVLAAMVVTAVMTDAGSVRARLSRAIWSPGPTKLVVLPFRNLTGDPAQEYFSDGLTDEMITQLGRLQPQKLSVIARTSSMRYKNSAKAVDQIARELGVDYVLEGSARQENGRVRISTTLIHARDQTQRWTESYERELSSVLALQRDVARGVAGSLALTLLPTEQARLTSVRAVSSEAYDAFIRGRSHWYRTSPENLDTAMEYFKTALQKAPDYALAYVGISGVWLMRGTMILVPFDEAHAQAKAAALKAIELDGDLAEGHDVLARVLFWYEFNWQAAEKEYRRAIDLNPNYPDAHLYYSILLMTQGRPDEATLELGKALALDPINPFYQAMHAYQLGQVRRYGEAIVQARRTLRMPDAFDVTFLHEIPWRAFHQQRMYQEALAEAKAIFAVDPEIVDALSRGAAEGGYEAANRLAAETLARRTTLSYWDRENVAILYAFANQNQRSLDWLEKNFETRHGMMYFIGIDPHWDVLRSEPRFRELLRKLGLPDTSR
jgi:eukaryotic-like serine/threonine-protein kinase